MKRTTTMSGIAIALLAATIFLASCLGVETDVKVSSSGSGTLVARYTLSEELVSFGEVEANKGTLPVPLSREDIEASLAGRSGLSLKRWSRSKSGNDTIIESEIAFASLDALSSYLDPSGKLARVGSESGANRLEFSLGDNLPALDAQMKAIAGEAFKPYRFKFTIELPSVPSAAHSSVPEIRASIEGKKAIFEGAMSDIVAVPEAPSLSLAW